MKMAVSLLLAGVSPVVSVIVWAVTWVLFAAVELVKGLIK